MSVEKKGAPPLIVGGLKSQPTRSAKVISGWNASEQPRYRLERFGASQLSTAELLGICLVSGFPGVDAVSLARHLLDHFGSISGVLGAPIVSLQAFHGVGLAKAAQIKAMHELMARDVEVSFTKGTRFNDAGAVSRYLRQRLGHQVRESFACLFLNSKHELLAFEIMFHGSIDCTHVHPREVLRRALEHNASALILAHNHPSGIAEPSLADVQVTQDLKRLLAELDVRVLDHIVVTGGSTVSFAERGLL